MSPQPISHAIAEADLEARFGPPSPPPTVNKIKRELNEWMAEFIRHSPFVVLAASNAAADLDLSPKGGAPGFVAVVDAQTLLIPDYAGNNLFFGHRNLFENDHVGLLFFIPGEGWTVRVNGRAQLTGDEASLVNTAAQSREMPPWLYQIPRGWTTRAFQMTTRPTTHLLAAPVCGR